MVEEIDRAVYEEQPVGMPTEVFAAKQIKLAI
jgi:hypothetical protein